MQYILFMLNAIAIAIWKGKKYRNYCFFIVFYHPIPDVFELSKIIF